MYVADSTYWNIAYGRLPGETMKDEEGIANMKKLGQNIVWLLNRFLTTLVEKNCLIQKKALSLQSESLKMNFVYFAF